MAVLAQDQAMCACEREYANLSRFTLHVGWCAVMEGAICGEGKNLWRMQCACCASGWILLKRLIPTGDGVENVFAWLMTFAGMRVNAI